MTAYQTVNGWQTEDTMRSQLNAAGWDGKGSVTDAYARTTGGAVTTGAKDVATNPYPTTQQPQTPNNSGDLAAYYNAIAGFDRDQLAQNDSQFRAQLALQRDQLERIGVPQVEIQRRQMELEDQHFQQQLGLATRNQSFQEQMGRGQLGLNYLSQASQFAASDPFALSDFMHGAALNNDVPVFLQNLRSGASPAPGVGSVGPEARGATTLPMLMDAMGGGPGAGGGGGPSETVESLLAKNPSLADPAYQQVLLKDRGWVFWPGEQLGANGRPTAGSYPIQNAAPTQAPGPATTINPQTGPALGAIGDIYRQGADKLAVGSLEGLDTNELNTMGAGITRLYGSQATPAFLQAYQRSRPMQTAASGVAYRA